MRPIPDAAYLGHMPTIALLSTAEVAAVLGRDVRSVHRAAARGDLPYAHKGNGIRGAYTFEAEVVHKIAAAEATRNG